ncbi:hypothetical protein SAMN04487987_101166 [Algibacter pectinivorans]|uniref:Group-specific protein n=1 Tax=Algibacter pectinivorans TaxID=870482 RepID=A0A1I1MCT3_9FLAO|nr:hypothetical protein SAMN04487987_101166 [Algibacter pectinivorans]
MRNLHYTNCFFYSLTLIPYITIYYFIYGMYAQLILGVTQIIMALVLLFFGKKLNREIKKHLKNYWILTLGILLLIFLFTQANSNTNEIILVLFVFILPMGIASYFLYITHLIRKQ